MQQIKQSVRGFSLLEMLVVTAIIGLLASTMVFSYSQFVRQSHDARRKTDLENIRAALEQYRSNNNQYPATGSIDFATPGSLCDPGGCAAGVYMQKLPQDPKTANTYWYQVSGGNNDYTLCTCLAGGGTPGTGSCGPCPSANTCNYCVGPYGQK